MGCGGSKPDTSPPAASGQNQQQAVTLKEEATAKEQANAAVEPPAEKAEVKECEKKTSAQLEKTVSQQLEKAESKQTESQQAGSQQLEKSETQKLDKAKTLEKAGSKQLEKTESNQAGEAENKESLQSLISTASKSLADLRSQMSEGRALTTKPSGALSARTPDVDADTFMKMNPDGMYLIHEERDGGAFVARYSKVEVPGALAFAKASEFVTIPQFKYKKPIQIQTKTHSGRTMYYQAWAQWIKEARLLEGEFVLLNALDEMEETQPAAFPPMRIFFLTGTKVDEIPRGMKNRPFKLKFAEAVAVVSDTYTGLDDLTKTEVDLKKFSDRTKAAADKMFMEFK